MLCVKRCLGNGPNVPADARVSQRDLSFNFEFRTLPPRDNLKEFSLEGIGLFDTEFGLK